MKKINKLVSALLAATLMTGAVLAESCMNEFDVFYPNYQGQWGSSSTYNQSGVEHVLVQAGYMSPDNVSRRITITTGYKSNGVYYTISSTVTNRTAGKTVDVINCGSVKEITILVDVAGSAHGTLAYAKIQQ